MLQYKRIGVTIKSDFEGQRAATEKIVGILERIGADIFLDSKRKEKLQCGKELQTFTKTSEIDLLLIIGGDGTILRTVREMTDFSVPILSVNRGTVGFLAETEIEEVETLIPELLSGGGIIDERELLEVAAYRGKDVLHSGIALNEAVIAQGMIARLINLRTTVNDEPLTTYHADGLIISTPTGSTAYSLSAGGPIVHPRLSAMILTAINPHTFSQKPIAIRSDAKVCVEVNSKESKFSDASIVLTIDGQVYIPLQTNDRVIITKSAHTLKFLRRKQETFFGTLRQKLKWGERVDD